MQPTMTTGEWLRRAAEAWSEADATVDPKAGTRESSSRRRIKRLAKHATFLAEGDAYPSVGWLGEMMRSMNNACRSFGLRFRRLDTAVARR